MGLTYPPHLKAIWHFVPRIVKSYDRDRDFYDSTSKKLSFICQENLLNLILYDLLLSNYKSELYR